MVLLERLSSNNFENFKNLNLERFSKENYDKNFFEYYENEKFFLKIFLKKRSYRLYMVWNSSGNASESLVFIY